MRILQDDVPMLLSHRPYQGATGAALYVAAVEPENDPGPSALEYRRNRILNGADTLLVRNVVYPLGASSVPKSPALAFVKQPTDQLAFEIPETWAGKLLHVNIRTHAADFENETISGSQRLLIDGDGIATELAILGTARLLAAEKRDGGGVRIRWVWTRAKDGTQPEQFVVVPVSGPTTPDPVIVLASSARNYEAIVSGLQNAGSYVFRVDAENGSTTATVIASIPFTADAAGPPAVSSLVATPR